MSFLDLINTTKHEPLQKVIAIFAISVQTQLEAFFLVSSFLIYYSSNPVIANCTKAEKSSDINDTCEPTKV